MNIQEYIYEEVLMEELKLNKLSNRIGKIILKAYNIISKLDNAQEYEESLELLKQMRVELLTLEKKYYDKDIEPSDLRSHLKLYRKGLSKIKNNLGSIDNKKIDRVLKKMDDASEKLKNIENLIY